MGSAHREDQGRLVLERDDHIGRDRMPFPMAGEPLHTAAEAPMTRAARHNHAVKLVLAHFFAQRAVAALVFLPGELVVNRVAVIGRAIHIREWAVLIESRAHLFPCAWRRRTRRLDVHGISILAVADGDGAAGGLDRLLGELNIGDLLDRRLFVLVDVAVLGAVVDRPLVRAGSKPVLTDQTQFFVSMSMAYST